MIEPTCTLPEYVHIHVHTETSATPTSRTYIELNTQGRVLL